MSGMAPSGVGPLFPGKAGKLGKVNIMLHLFCIDSSQNHGHILVLLFEQRISTGDQNRPKGTQFMLNTLLEPDCLVL